MSDLFRVDEASTPLAAEERRDLIPSHIAFRQELNLAEQENIVRGQAWALGRRRDVLQERFVRELHRRMFHEVWRWAGKYRTTPRNLGIDHWLIPVEVPRLLEDAGAWVDLGSFDADEIAVRLHHRLVWIHPFANGNGRHARLMADLLVMQLGRARFTWGRESLGDIGVARAQYIDGLRQADRHSYQALIAFSRA